MGTGCASKPVMKLSFADDPARKGRDFPYSAPTVLPSQIVDVGARRALIAKFGHGQPCFQIWMRTTKPAVRAIDMHRPAFRGAGRPSVDSVQVGGGRCNSLSPERDKMGCLDGFGRFDAKNWMSRRILSGIRSHVPAVKDGPFCPLQSLERGRDQCFGVPGKIKVVFNDQHRTKVCRRCLFQYLKVAVKAAASAD